MQVFDINLAPGGSRVVDVQASYVYYLSGSAGGADSTLAVSPTGGGETVYLKPGQAYKVAAGASVGSRWTIANLKNAGTIIGQVLMGEGEFSDNRVSGSVEIIDGGKARTQADLACMGYAYRTPNSGEFAHVQLFNPANSGTNFFVEQIGFYSNIPAATAPSGVQIAQFSTAFTTLYANPSRKRMGASNSVAELRTTSNVLQQTQGSTLAAIDATQKLVRFSEPIMIAPGKGIVVVANNAGETVGAYFEFFEEAV